MRPVITSVKHIRQSGGAVTIASGAINNFVLANSKELSAVTSADQDVREGCVIKAVYIEIWLFSDDAAATQFTLTVEKRNGNAPQMTFGNSQALNDYDNKKNIFYTTQGLAPSNLQSGIPVIRQWIKIPKGKQRMGHDDAITVNIAAIANGIVFCGFSTYKEYY